MVYRRNSALQPFSQRGHVTNQERRHTQLASGSEEDKDYRATHEEASWFLPASEQGQAYATELELPKPGRLRRVPRNISKGTRNGGSCQGHAAAQPAAVPTGPVSLQSSLAAQEPIHTKPVLLRNARKSEEDGPTTCIVHVFWSGAMHP